VTVDDLIAREEIRHCLLRHFRAADRLDIELEKTAFWPDGHFVGGPLDGPMTEFAGPLFEEMLPKSFERVMHYIANMLVTIDGDMAQVELYGIGYHLLVDDAATIEGVIGAKRFNDFGRDANKRYELLVGVRYAVTLQRRGGEWRILTMQPIIEWTRVQHHAGIVDGGLPSAMPTVPMRDRSDASYFGGGWQP
jgi:SnoaL-like domain